MADAVASWEALDRELGAMVDIFTNMIKASRVADEEADQLGGGTRDARKDRAPGDLLEVWADKLVHAGHNALHHAAALKSTAVFSDFTELIGRVRRVREALAKEDAAVASALTTMRVELMNLVSQLETSYFSTPYRSPPAASEMSSDLKELVSIAMEMAQKDDGGRQGSGAGATAVGSR